MLRKILLGCVFAAFIVITGSSFNEACAQEPAHKPGPKERPKKATRREAAPTTGNSIKGATVKGNTDLSPPIRAPFPSSTYSRITRWDHLSASVFLPTVAVAQELEGQG
jgi:hypothetical protein